MNRAPEFPSGHGELSAATEELKQSTPNFDITPDVSPENAEPSSITVIFKDSFKIRSKKNKELGKSIEVTANLSEEASRLNEVFSFSGIDRIDDTSIDIDEKTADLQESKSESYWRNDAPNAKSILHLKFKKFVNMQLALEKIRSQKSVRIAYLTPKMVPSGLINRFSTSNLSGSKPSDEVFSRDPEQGVAGNHNIMPWYWFNRHRVFDSWNQISGIQKPSIALIDTGFDTDAAAYDRPNYQPGKYIDQYGILTSSDVREDTILYDKYGNPYPNDKLSHGTSTASILGSPSQSGSGSGLCGVLPNVPIIPIKWKGTTASIAAAIRYAVYNTNAWVIDVGVSTDLGQPITFDASVLSAVQDATAWGKTVVIPAGNTYRNLDLDVIQDGGAIVVGGSALDGKNWKQPDPLDASKWVGSSYGKIVTVAASAENIAAATYIPNYGGGTPYRKWDYMSGTSFAHPMVAATVAMARMIYGVNGGTAVGSDVPRYLKQLIWGSATIAATRGNEQLGYKLDDSARNPLFVAKMRDLNMANAFILAKYPNIQPIVRIHNGTDQSWGAINWDWTNKHFATEYISDDAIWNLHNTGLTASDTLNLWNYNFNPARSHGFQVWRNGNLVDEHLGGASERRAPWSSGGYSFTVLYGTIKEDPSSNATGWTTQYNIPAIR